MNAPGVSERWIFLSMMLWQKNLSKWAAFWQQIKVLLTYDAWCDMSFGLGDKNFAWRRFTMQSVIVSQLIMFFEEISSVDTTALWNMYNSSGRLEHGYLCIFEPADQDGKRGSSLKLALFYDGWIYEDDGRNHTACWSCHYCCSQQTVNAATINTCLDPF